MKLKNLFGEFEIIKNLKKDSIFGRLMLSHLIIIFISLTVIGLMFGYLVQNYYHGLKEWEATNNSRRIAKLVSESLSEGNLRSPNIEESKEKINTIARSSNMDIGLMNKDGEMLLNSSTIRDFELTLEEHEINHILKGNTFTKKILGPENRNLLMVVPLINEDDDISAIGSQPIKEEEKIIGAVTIQTPLGGITETINNIIKLIIYSFIVAIFAAGILSLAFARKITKPLANIQKSALQSARGNFNRVEPPDNSSEEIKHLVNTYNYAVSQIDKTMNKRKKLEKSQKEFVANVSHEFRAPLTSIKGFLELILEQYLSEKEIKEYTEIMYQDAEYLENLLSELLVLGELDANDKEEGLKIKDCDMELIITRALKSLEKSIEEKNIKIDYSAKGRISSIPADKNKIQQVLINLLENAITYSPENSTIKIQLKEAQETNKYNLICSISDEGPGIPEEEQDKIWQRFYKIDDARTRNGKEGSGLGLAIVKNIIERHNGIIEVKSNSGEGTTFTFKI